MNPIIYVPVGKKKYCEIEYDESKYSFSKDDKEIVEKEIDNICNSTEMEGSKVVRTSIGNIKFKYSPYEKNDRYKLINGYLDVKCEKIDLEPNEIIWLLLKKCKPDYNRDINTIANKLIDYTKTIDIKPDVKGEIYIKLLTLIEVHCISDTTMKKFFKVLTNKNENDNEIK